MDSDDEREAGGGGAGSQPVAPAGSQPVAPGRSEFGDLEIDGLAISVGFSKGPGFLAPSGADQIERLLRHLDSAYDQLLAEGRNDMAEKLATKLGGPQELLKKVAPYICKRDGAVAKHSVDTGKIRYDLAKTAFVLTWHPCKQSYLEGEKPRKQYKGFEVPRHDLFGVLLPKEEYSAGKRAVLGRARLEWNKVDKSDAPRFPV